MKTKFHFVFIFVVLLFITYNLVFAQDNTKSMQISEPVPGAEITVEQVPGPIIIKSSGKTNQKGEFTLILNSEQLQKLPNEFQLKFTIKPKDPIKYPVENNSAIVKVKKSDGPKFVFVVTFQKSTVKTNKGTFAVNAKAQT